MASGRLGAADLTADTDTLLYTVPAGKIATVNIRVTNRNAISAAITLAIGPGQTPAAADYIEYQAPLDGHLPLEDTGLILSAGEKVWARASLASVSVRVHGYEGDA